ncbi:MAG TPA: glycosyltransferase, partial [Candidatus Woesebacteria bacterium]|nr:glycosyltransferase [Candidatus Woesebacteria bacterium]
MGNILRVEFHPQSKNSILEKILLYLDDPQEFVHIVSLNPETVVEAYHSDDFNNVLSEGDIQLIDGIGIILGGFLLGNPVENRITGVDFMKDLLKLCKNKSLRVLF